MPGPRFFAHGDAIEAGPDQLLGGEAARGDPPQGLGCAQAVKGVGHVDAH
jgi:hypothetical protein